MQANFGVPIFGKVFKFIKFSGARKAHERRHRWRFAADSIGIVVRMGEREICIKYECSLLSQTEIYTLNPTNAAKIGAGILSTSRHRQLHSGRSKFYFVVVSFPHLGSCNRETHCDYIYILEFLQG